MKELPDGFQLHSGLDGLVVGLAIVFVVKVETVISSYIDWSQVVVVGKVLRGTKQFFIGVGNWVGDVWSGFGSSLSSSVGSGGASGAAGGAGGAGGAAGTGVAAGSGSAGGAATGGVGVPVVGEAASFLASGSIKLVGFSVPLLGVGGASIVEKILIILGVWIAILSPLYYWVIQPGIFWWRKREVA